MGGADKLREIKGRTETCRVALTGGAGSGKSSVADHLRERGARVISADLLAREVVAVGAPGYRKLVARFGASVLLEDGELDRRKLRGMITSDPDARAEVESIVQPAIVSLMEERMAAEEKRGAPVVVVEVPLLFEMGLEGRFDRVLIVSVDREERVRRLMRRDMVTEERARALIDLQISEADRASRKGDVIKNNGSLEETLKAVDKWYYCCLKGGNYAEMA